VYGNPGGHDSQERGWCYTDICGDRLGDLDPGYKSQEQRCNVPHQFFLVCLKQRHACVRNTEIITESLFRYGTPAHVNINPDMQMFVAGSECLFMRILGKMGAAHTSRQAQEHKAGIERPGIQGAGGGGRGGHDPHVSPFILCSRPWQFPPYTL
jgi:hypothetical protein